jgi:serine/threonine protein kinase
MSAVTTGESNRRHPSQAAGAKPGEKSMQQAKPDPLPAGARLAEFEILDVLAHGDFGVLYRAHDALLERDIMLREYLPPGIAMRAGDGAVRVRSNRDEDMFRFGLRGFIDEARLLARLDHPGLMKVQRFWEANGSACMAMPFHEGMLLDEAIALGRAHGDEASLSVLLADLLGAAEALHAAHGLHGGIAPDTILLRQDGRGMLFDAGSARKALNDLALTPGMFLKHGYAAIEQYEAIPGARPGPWTDVYALAAVAYTLIAGNAPPSAEDRLEHDTLIPARELGQGRYRDSFLAAIDDALVLLPEQRTQSPAQLRAALGIGAEVAAGPPPASTPEPLAAPPAASAREAMAAPLLVSATERMASSPLAGTTEAMTPPSMAGAAAAASAAPADIAPAFHHRSRVNDSNSRQGVREAVLMVCIAGALYAGFRLLGTHEDKPGEPVPVAVTKPAAPAPSAPPAQTAPAPTAAHTTPAPAAPQASPPASASAQPAPSAPPAQTASNADAPGTPQTRAEAAHAAPPTLPPRPAAGPNDKPPALAAAEAGRRALERREEEDWLAAQSLDTLASYETFVNSYPDSRHAPAARVMIARLRWEQRQAAASGKAAGTGNGTPAGPETRPPQAAQAAGNALPRTASAAPARTGQAPLIEDRISLARPPEASTVPVNPGPPAGGFQAPPLAPETATVEGRTIRLRGQTMTGDFTTDPVSGAVSGRGRIVWDNGDRFEGTLVRGVKEGRGEFIWANGQRYRGDWSGGLPNGRGSIQFPNGNRYEGEMRNGAPNGSGSIAFANGNRYTGEVRDGLPNGRGTNRFANGDSYAGAWRMGKSHGHGRYTWANGDYWEGEFRDGARTANGSMVVAARADARPPAAPASGSAPGTADAEDPFLR